MPSHAQTAKHSILWSTPLLLTLLSPSGCFPFSSPHPHRQAEQELGFVPLGQLDDVQLPLALPDLQRWSQTTGRGSAVTFDWVG